MPLKICQSSASTSDLPPKADIGLVHTVSFRKLKFCSQRVISGELLAMPKVGGGPLLAPVRVTYPPPFHSCYQQRLNDKSNSEVPRLGARPSFPRIF
jgi:hypothetical protein